MFFICRDEGVGNNVSPVLGENRSGRQHEIHGAGLDHPWRLENIKHFLCHSGWRARVEQRGKPVVIIMKCKFMHVLWES